MSDKSAVLRSAYRPLSWLVSEVELHFTLDASATTVQSRLQLVRNPAAAAGPIVLYGEDLELLQLHLDGRPPQACAIENGVCRIEIDAAAESACAEITTRLAPEKNTALSGLYASRGGLFTQCEAEGFRRITWFPDRPDVMARYTVTLEADRARYPVLLANGNLVEAGDLPHGRHFARWHDPFPKPSYLFALVAADLVANEQRIRTASGREVLLQVWSEAAHRERTEHAMASLIRAIRWDEERFGLELDLDRFMVVAVADFNMGAMENKGLNIFNAKLLLASPETATDADYANIEAVVAHEYFHNWTGNRVTCRDWFQLTLKEGLTVFRDQEFSADVLAAPYEAAGDARAAASARAVKRISDVRILRSSQFPEDAGPMAHPIRPESYREIDNFYTATVYEKGAEVIRMLQTMLGRAGFRQGMDLYFQRHDGQAVTCDDFIAAMADANDCRLDQFMRWYSQAGTPRLSVRGSYDAAAQTYALHVAQNDQSGLSCNEAAQPLLVPLAVALLAADGSEIAGSARLLEVSASAASWTFTGVSAPPYPSLLRNFSAPVQLDFAEDDAALAQRMAHDSDPFNRWDAGQRLFERALLDLAARCGAGAPAEQLETPPALLAAFAQTLADHQLDAAFRAQMLALPAESYLLEQMRQAHGAADPAALRRALQHLKRALGERFAAEWCAIHAAARVDGPYRYHPQDAGRRALAGLALGYLAAAGSAEGCRLARAQFAASHNMSDRIFALSALTQSNWTAARTEALAAFYQRHADDPLVLDKWFALQAGAWRWDAAAPPLVDELRALSRHPAFSRSNPNKVYALWRTFFFANPGEFHTPEGHALWAEEVLQLDRINPQVAARLARALENWRAFIPELQASMLAALHQLAAAPALSSGVGEIVDRALAGA